jgi:deoxyxylulose-5-phosphate synthase
MNEHSRENPPAPDEQRLLAKIDGPGDLHGLTEEQLVRLAEEVREHIIDTVGEIGGHFGANLGTRPTRTRS